jgi:hypothetical protein
LDKHIPILPPQQQVPWPPRHAALDSLFLFAGDWQVVEFDLSLRIVSDGWIVEIVVVIGLILVFHHILLVLKSWHSFEDLRFPSSVEAENSPRGNAVAPEPRLWRQTIGYQSWIVRLLVIKVWDSACQYRAIIRIPGSDSDAACEPREAKKAAAFD